jgi:hypothetical protein
MDIVDKINDIIAILEDSVSYEDWKSVEEAIKELNFLVEELDSDFPLDQYEDEY